MALKSRPALLVRMVMASLVRRKSRVAIAFTALVIGAAITSGLASVYYDIGQKMSRELRAYGANMVLAPSTPEQQPFISLTDVNRIASLVPGNRLIGYSPYLYGLVELRSQKIVAVGADFRQVKAVSPYWKIQGEMAGDAGYGQQALMGAAVSEKLRLKIGDKVRVNSTETGKAQEMVISGLLSTGSTEENQLFIDIELAGELFNRPGAANIAYLSLLGEPQELELLTQKVATEFPGVAARPIKRVSQAEGQVLGKISSLVYLAVGIILFLTLLCVAITMMDLATERRREIGLKKALGAQDRDIMWEFLAEGSMLGAAGGALGWLLGLILAQAIGQSVFHSAISLRPETLPPVVLLAAGLAGLASLIPALSAAGVEPATTLRGE